MIRLYVYWNVYKHQSGLIQFLKYGFKPSNYVNRITHGINTEYTLIWLILLRINLILFWTVCRDMSFWQFDNNAVSQCWTISFQVKLETGKTGSRCLRANNSTPTSTREWETQHSHIHFRDTCVETWKLNTYEPRSEKVSDKVRHKLSCTATEDG